MEFILGLIIDLAVGAVSGWLAGKIMHSEGSLLRNIILGVLGGLLAGLLLSSSSLIGSIVVSVLGACALIAIVRAVTKK